jgi:hypothetical protein
MLGRGLLERSLAEQSVLRQVLPWGLALLERSLAAKSVQQ